MGVQWKELNTNIELVIDDASITANIKEYNEEVQRYKYRNENLGRSDRIDNFSCQ